MQTLPDTVKITGCNDILSSKRFTTEICVGRTIAEILQANHVVLSDCLNAHIWLNGEPVARYLWSSIIPKADDLLVFRVVPSGGDDKNPLNTILSIAVIAVAIYAPYAAGLAGTFKGAALAASVSMVGMMAVNAIAPPPVPKMDTLSGTDDIAKVSPSIAGGNNPYNPYGPVPSVLGTARITPPHAARPYTENHNDDQYLRQLFIIGHGDIDVYDMRIGETELGAYLEAQYNIVKPGDSLEYFKTDVDVDDVNTLVAYGASWAAAEIVERSTGADTEEISINMVFPYGLAEYSYGYPTILSVGIEIRYAPYGTTDWVYPLSSGGSYSARESPVFSWGTPRYYYDDDGVQRQVIEVFVWGLGINIFTGEIVIYPVTGYEADWERAVRNQAPASVVPVATVTTVSNQPHVIDSGDITNLSRWVTGLPIFAAIANASDFIVTSNGTDTVDVSAGTIVSGYNLNVTANSTTTLRKTYNFSVASGQYTVQVRRTTADRPATTSIDSMYWDTLLSIKSGDAVTETDVTMVEVRIKATDQINGIVDTFNCMARNMDIEIYDPVAAAWLPAQDSSNPADLYRHVLQGPANHNAVADTKIDLDELIDWHASCSDTIIGIGYTGNYDAVDKLDDTTVGIPVTGHGVEAGTHILISGTTNYDEEYVVLAASTTDEIVITAVYVAETFATATDSIVVPGLKYNKIIDYQSSVNDILTEIAAAGKASPAYFDGKFSVVQDKPRTTPVQHFTPRNSFGFSSNKNFYESPHAWKVRFINELENYRQDERIVYADGYAAVAGGGDLAATEFEELELPGTTHPVHVFMLARYHMAAAQLRPEIHRFNTDIEYLVCTRGDFVKLSHDVPNWKQNISSGRIKSLTLSSTNITHIELDEICTFEAATDYCVRIRLNDMTSSYHNVVFPAGGAGDYNTVELSTPVDEATSGIQVGDLITFGERLTETVDVLVKSIRPSGDLTAQVEVVDLAPAVHTADSGTIPDFTTNISLPANPLSAIGAPVISEVRSDESVFFRTPDGTLLPRIVVSFSWSAASLYHLSNIERTNVTYHNTSAGTNPWIAVEGIGLANDIILTDVEVGAEYDIRAYCTVNVDGVLQITEVTDQLLHTVEGVTSTPSPPTALGVAAATLSVLVSVTPPNEPDVAAVEVWRSTSTTFPGGTADYAKPVVYGSDNNTTVINFFDQNVTAGTTYYYWAGTVDVFGTQSATQVGGATHSVVPLAASISTDVTQEDGTTPLTDDDVLNENQSANDIQAGTITGSTLQTSATGQRFIVSASANEAEFWGYKEIAETTIAQLATIGVGGSGDRLLAQFGTSDYEGRCVSIESESVYSSVYVENNYTGTATIGAAFFGSSGNSVVRTVYINNQSTTDYGAALVAEHDSDGVAAEFFTGAGGVAIHVPVGGVEFDGTLLVGGMVTVTKAGNVVVSLDNTSTGADWRLTSHNSAGLYFTKNGTTQWIMESDGDLLPGSDSSFAIGGTSYRVSFVYTDEIVITSTPPAAYNSSGVAGQVQWGGNYLYLHNGTRWGRTLIDFTTTW